MCNRARILRATFTRHAVDRAKPDGCGLRRGLRRLGLAFGVLAMLFAAPVSAQEQAGDLQQAVARELERLLLSGVEAIPVTAARRGPSARTGLDELVRFYYARGFRPLWVDARGARGSAREVIRAIARADEHGLARADYALERIRWRLHAARADTLAELEMLLSAAFVDYARHAANGRVGSSAFSRLERVYPRRIDAAALLARAAAMPRPVELLQAHAPQDNRLYRELVRALAVHRAIAATGGWPRIPEGPALRLGERDPRVPVLRARLRASGDLVSRSALAAAEPGSDRFDAALEVAVQRFQRRHGLEVDGVVGPHTRAALNVSVQARIRQMILSLERIRWMPHELGERHVLVNTAGFRAYFVESGEPVLGMNVVVGRRYRQTPTFSDEMSYLVLNPYWNVPRSIARNEIIPEVVEDPRYLEENHLQVVRGWSHDAEIVDPALIDWRRAAGGDFPYRLRQTSGAHNALGRVKFMFPNHFNVYLHDTPAKHLFERPRRTYSHGCIRLSEPMALAARLLAAEGWSETELERVMATGERTVLALGRRVPVHVTYLTAWVEPGGTVQFREDVYRRDEKLAESLRTGPTLYHYAMRGG